MSEGPVSASTRPLADTPARAFLALALPAGLLCAALFPPFSMPDEPAHFYRAYAISRGDLLPAREAAGFGGSLPASVPALVAEVASGGPFQSAAPSRAIRQAFEHPAAPGGAEFVDYRTASQVTVVPYLPAAAGIAAARILGLPLIAQFYVTRLAVLLCAALVTWIAIHQMPAYGWLLALIALTPMITSLRSAVSADGMTTALAFLVTATIAKLAWGGLREPAERSVSGWDLRGSGTKTDWWIVGLGSMTLCLTKPVYFPLALLAVSIPAERWPGGWKRTLLLLHWVMVGATLVVAGWVAARVDVSMRPGSAADRSGQIQQMLDQPARAAGIVAADYVRHAARYGSQLFGKQLGWLDLALPTALIVFYLAAVILLWAADGDAAFAPSAADRLIWGLSLLAVLVLVSVSQYATFTPLRSPFVEGIQGRYFLPVVPAALLLAHRRPGANAWLRRHRAGLVIAVACAGLGIAFAAALDHYWLAAGW